MSRSGSNLASALLASSAALALLACADSVMAQTASALIAPAQSAQTSLPSLPSQTSQTSQTYQTSDAGVEGIVVTAKRYVPTETLSGSKTNTPLIEIPQSITVINRDQIDLLNERTLGEAVRYAAGVNGDLFGADQRYDWLTVRGFTPVEYIDGLQAPVGAVQNSGIDLFGADSVEILKGPSSGLYGLAPPGGIINLTSRRPQDIFGGELQVQGGSYSNKQVAGDVTGPIVDGVDFRLTGLYRDSDTQTQNVYDRRYYIAPALTWKIDGQTSLTLLGYFQRDKVLNDGGGFLPAYGALLANPDGQLPTSENLGQRGYNQFKREQWGYGYDFKHTFNDTFAFEQNLKYFGNNNSTLQLYGAGLATNADGTTNYNTETRYNYPSHEEIRSFNVDNRLTAKFDVGPVSNLLLVGLDYRNYFDHFAYGFGSASSVNLYNAQTYASSAIVTPATAYPYISEQQDQAGFYVQDQAKLGRFVFTAGAREDLVDQYSGTATTPLTVHTEDKAFTYRGGVTYVFDSGLAPYVSYATSFQPTTGANTDGSPFKPTTGDQVEGGVKFEPRYAPAGIKTLATAAVFDLHQTNVVAPDLASTPVLSEQIGKVHVAGLELEDVTRISEQLSVNFSYSYMFTKASPSLRYGGPNTPPAEVGAYNTDPALAMTPKNKASLLVDYTFAYGLLKGLGIGAGVRYTGATFGDAAGEWRNPSEVLWDGLLHYNFDKWRLQVNATNLFDKSYVVQCSSYTSCYYGLRRNVVASLTRAF
jgi:iron complex outermembrane receptor protein